MTKDEVALLVPRAEAPFLALALRVGDEALRKAANRAGVAPFASRATVSEVVRLLDPEVDKDRAAEMLRAYTVADAAQALGLTERAVRKRVSKGRLRARRLPDRNRSILIDADHVDAEVFKKVGTND